MRQRIHNLTGDNDTGYISTFHSFCVSVLQEDSHALQYPKSFLVLDNSDIDSMLKIIYEERGLTLRNMTFSKARDMIEIRKIFKEPEYYLDMLNMSINQTFSRTVNTSLTTLLPVIALYLWGGPVLQSFSFALLIGILVGTYSSIYIASGLLAEWWIKAPQKTR